MKTLGTALGAAALVLACVSTPAAREARALRSPEEYLSGCLAAHEVVVLGEMHEQRQTLELLAREIPRWRREGLRLWATEFLRSRNTGRANALIGAPVFDRGAAEDLYRDFAWIWGFREYVDVFEALWRANREASRPEDRIRLAGLDFEWQDWPGARVEAETNRDRWMADRFREAWSPGTRAVVHCGSTHSLRANFAWGPFLGGHLAETVGGRLFVVRFHQALLGDQGEDEPGPVIPALEELWKARGGRGFGLDLKGSRWAGLSSPGAWQFDGGRLTLGDVADGYVLVEPLDRLGRMHWIPGFVDQSNRAKTAAVARDRGWFPVDGQTSAAELNDRMRRVVEGR